MEDKSSIKVYAFNSDTRSFEPTDSNRESEPKTKSSHTPQADNRNTTTNQKQKVQIKNKKYGKILFLWCKLLQKLDQKLYPKQIARQLDLSQQIVDYHIKKMKADGLISQEIKSNITSYIVTESGRRFIQENRGKQKVSLGVSEAHTSANIRTHNLKLKLRILSDNPSANLKQEREYRAIQKKNWTSELFILTYPIGMTIEKTTQSIIINYHEFDCKPESYTRDFVIAMNKGMLFLYDYLSRKYQIKVDIFAPEILDDHMANPHPELDEVCDKRASVEIGLNRKASAIYPSKQDGKAWMDFSPGHVEVETNDLPFQQAFLQMPSTVAHLREDFLALNNQVVTLNNQVMPVVNQFGVQLALHLDVIGKMSTAMQNIEHHVAMQSNRETVPKNPSDSVSPSEKVSQKIIKCPKNSSSVLKSSNRRGRPKAQIDMAELARIQSIHPEYGIRRLARRMHVSKNTLDYILKRSKSPGIPVKDAPKVEAPRAQQSDLEKLVFHQPR